MTPAEEMLIRSLPQALSETDIVCSSVNVGSTKTGIDMNSCLLYTSLWPSRPDRR